MLRIELTMSTTLDSMTSAISGAITGNLAALRATSQPAAALPLLHRTLSGRAQNGGRKNGNDSARACIAARHRATAASPP